MFLSRKISALILALFLGTLSTPLSAAESNTRFGSIAVQGYYDTRDFAIVTIDTFAKLHHNLEYFSFVNFYSPTNASNRLDTERYFTEQHLRWGPAENFPLDLTGQFTFQTGTNNDVFRPGVRWRAHDTPILDRFLDMANLTYTLNITPYTIELSSQTGWQMQFEHFYRWQVFPSYFDDRVYVQGFFDHNIGFDGAIGGDSQKIVTEHQVGFRTVDQLYVVGEFRYNEYWAGDEFGIGLGVEYKLLFK